MRFEVLALHVVIYRLGDSAVLFSKHYEVRDMHEEHDRIEIAVFP